MKHAVYPEEARAYYWERLLKLNRVVVPSCCNQPKRVTDLCEHTVFDGPLREGERCFATGT